MKLEKIAKELGIDPVPCQLSEYIDREFDFSICDLSKIDEIDIPFGIFGKCKEKLAECAELVSKNPALVAYGNAATAYINEHSLREAQALPLPEFNYDTPLRFLPLLIYAATLPNTIKTYHERGFSDDEIRGIFRNSGSGRVARAEMRTGMQGLDLKGYRWLLNYVKGTIFSAGIFGVTPRPYDGHAIVLKNKNTGEYAVLLASGRYDKSGAAYGSTGYNNIENTFETDFTETEKSYFGYPTKNSKAAFERVEYRKSDWEIYLKKGDGVAGIHIPTGSKLTPENIERGFKLVLERTRYAFPELNIKCVDCASWLLDPTLSEILGEGSKIVDFQKYFSIYPIRSNEKSVFGHVFPSAYESYETLPEDTTLQRKLKEMYINGSYIYDFGGFVLD